jgi:putative ABC transport system substrate-binding protein
MKRREFITLIGGAATWPLAARAQGSVPLIGFLNGGTADGFASRVNAFRRGLAKTGYNERQNVEIEYRWAEGHFDRLPGLALDLISRNVALLVTSANVPAAMAAKGATATIPIVFVIGADPVTSGIVSGLNRPGGNITGFSNQSVKDASKSLQLLAEMLPQGMTIGVLVNPLNTNVETYLSDATSAATELGRKLVIAKASNDHEIDEGFAAIAQRGANGLFVASDTLFNTQPERLAALAARHHLPAIFAYPNYVEAGGLMSYGPDPNETYDGAGIYVGRILKGEKPADLPVQLTTKFELVINLKTAKALGLNIPPMLLARADEVVE